MHICFITSEYPKTGFPHGGIGSFIKTVAQELIKNNIKVSVVGVNYSDNFEFETSRGIDIYRIKPSKVKGFIWLLNAIAINKQIGNINITNPISIVETSELGLAFINKIKNIKYVIRLHGGHHFFAESENRGINYWKGFQEKRSFKKADGFIAVSNYVKTHTEKFLSYNNKIISLINYPINTTTFQPIDQEIIPNKIVFAGTVCEKKGVRQLIQAFAIVKKKFPDATLDIYGRDWFFPNGNSYVEMLKILELPKLGHFAADIYFHGAINYDQIPSKYAIAEVCVFPSHMETQGLVAPEAMAMEKIVIFTELGPGIETISDFKTGLLCNPHDAASIAEKIIWVFNNKNKAIEIGKNGRKFIIEKYILDKIVQQNIDFYSSLLQH